MSDYAEERSNFIIEKDGFIEFHWSGLDPRPQYRFIEYNTDHLFIKAYPPISSEVASQTNDTPTIKGTGFVLASNGLIVTNYHVVKDARLIEIVFPETNLIKESHILIKDSQNDIAILGINNFSESILGKIVPFIIADAKRIKTGRKVYTLGFPLGEIMGTTPRASYGHINSQYGIQDDPRVFQISNPLQPGNSGGPLFNEKGEVVGIVVSGLNAKYLFEHAGIIPQNVNFALKSDYLKNLISMLPNADKILNRNNSVIQGPIETQIEQLSPFIVQIRAH
jgi:serine protease Do